jgi:hypothetical protein
MRCNWAVRVLAVLLAALAFVPAAGAKDGVVARLANPEVLRAPGGTRVGLVWTLKEGRQPFGAAGIYVRLNGGREILAATLAPGRFRARLTIPRGGVRSIVIALQGWATDANGTRRADYRFPILNDPTR